MEEGRRIPFHIGHRVIGRLAECCRGPGEIEALYGARNLGEEIGVPQYALRGAKLAYPGGCLDPVLPPFLCKGAGMPCRLIIIGRKRVIVGNSSLWKRGGTGPRLCARFPLHRWWVGWWVGEWVD